MNLAFYGRITGLSGIFSGVVKRELGFEWKTCFLVGLMTLPAVFNMIFGQTIDIFGYHINMFDAPDSMSKT